MQGGIGRNRRRSRNIGLMPRFEILLQGLGGLGLFLLAMSMMTGGLRIFGGRGLRALLERSTSGSIRAALSGTLVTTLVQSSSAVTVATIGFVNAGILQLPGALGVIFGANLGTTFTGWLVSITGFGFKIENFALPMIGVGVALRLLIREARPRGLGEAIAGFGLFFLGLAILKQAFSGVAQDFGEAAVGEANWVGGLGFVAIGFLATLLTQSSSAAIALILTAASESAVGLGAAAAAIIGANIGTTSTAAFAVIGATPNAKRVATGHIVFNVGTGLIAVLILPVILQAIEAFGHRVGLDAHPEVSLALFHTVFNLLGLVIMLPLIGALSAQLGKRFVTAEEDLSRPRHLDRTLIQTPSLALPALKEELTRMSDLVRITAQAAIEGRAKRPLEVERQSEAIARLGFQVSEFATRLRMELLEREQAEHLPRLLRIARYLDEAALLIPEAAVVRRDLHRIAEEDAREAVGSLLVAAGRFLSVLEAAVRGEAGAVPQVERALEEFELIYQKAKANLLRSAAGARQSLEEVDRQLDALSRTRRMIQQLAKAARMLSDEAFLARESERTESE